MQHDEGIDSNSNLNKTLLIKKNLHVFTEKEYRNPYRLITQILLLILLIKIEEYLL